MTKTEEIRMQLNDCQIGVFLESLADPQSLKYNQPTRYRFNKSEIDLDKLILSVKEAVNNFSDFAIKISLDKDGNYFMYYDNSSEPEIEIEEAKEEDINKCCKNFIKPFELLNEKLYRLKIFKTEKSIYFLYDIHHVLMDGVGQTVFEKAIKAAYEGNELPKQKIDAIGLSQLIQKEAEKDNFKEDYDFFEKYISGLDIDSNLQVDKPDEANKNSDLSNKLSFAIPTKNTEIDSFTKVNHFRRSAFFQAVFAYTLAKFTYQNEVLFTIGLNKRNFNADLENSIGMMVRVLPFYSKIDEQLNSIDFIKSIQEKIGNIEKHANASFGELAKKHDIHNDISYVYQGKMIDGVYLDRAKGSCEFLDVGNLMSNLNIMVFQNSENYEISLEYKNSLYNEDSIRRFAECFDNIIKGFIHNLKLSDINLISPKDEKLINKFNSTEVPYDKSQTIVSLFRKQAKTTPENIAVVFKGKKYTYKQLDEVSDNIASHLAEKGIKNGDVVSVLMNRCEYFPFAALGALKAGAAYQPLDPSYPSERLNFMMKDASAKFLIADEKLLDLVSEYKGKVLSIKQLFNLPKAGKLPKEPKPEDAFILLYTSGTTGIPKGCILEHRNLVAFCNWYIKKFELNSNSRVAAYASFGFDANMMDTYPTLLSGAALHILPEDIRLNMFDMDKYFVENKITNAFMTTQIGRMFVEMTNCHTLKYFSVGGEKLVPLNPPSFLKFYNIYGPTETTVFATTFKLINDSKLLPIGVPNQNTKLYVIDKNMRQVPVGAMGELCIAGEQVGRGYLNRPEKTAEVFVENPFTDNPDYKRMYKTGDIVRWLPDGNIEFIGRRDGQVKIRGFRIELTEVEQIIRQYEGIKDATVTAIDAPGGGKMLVAYIVSDKTANIKDLNDFILSQKPPYMVPSFIMQLDKIPLNVNGKVDKRKLPKPEVKAKDIKLPITEKQKKILDILSDIVGTKEISTDIDIYEAGLSSIGSVKLIVKLSDEFKVSIGIKDLKNNNTIEKLENFINNLEPEENFEKYEDYPLSKTQEGIYVESSLNENSVNYNIPILIKLDSSLDIDKVKKSVVEAVNAHPFIKTRIIINEDGEPRFKRLDNDVFETKDIEEIHREKEKIEDIKAWLIQPFKLIGGQLFRIKLIYADGIYLFVEMHHIISDGTSMNIFLGDITSSYIDNKLEKEKFTGYEVILNEEKLRKTDELAKAKSYFQSIFDGCEPDCSLPTDLYDKTDKRANTFDYVSRRVMGNMIKEFCQKNELSLNSFFTAAFGFLLAKYNAREDSIFATIYNGRNDSRLQNTISMLVKTFPVMSRIAGENVPVKIVDYIKSIEKQQSDSMANDIYSFAEISREFGIKSDILFVYQGDSFNFDTLCGKTSKLIPIQSSQTKALMNFEIFIYGNELTYNFEYEASLYSQSFIQSFTEAYDLVISEFLNKEKLSEVELLSYDAAKLIQKFNSTEAAYDKNQTIVSLFRKQASTTPDNIAVVFKGKSYTYKQLDEVSDNLAFYLSENGIRGNDVVSILMNRCEYMPFAALGALKAGAAYQPLDPSYPPERLDFMLKDASAKILIADEKLVSLVHEYNGKILSIDDMLDLPKAGKLPQEPKPEDAFILLYTSGTTGIPKGCILEHRNLVAFCNWYIKKFELNSNSRVAAYASFGFDANMMDTYPTVLSGGTIHILPEDIRLNMVELDKYFVDNKITNAFMTTQIGRMFVEMTNCHTLKYFSVGGEKLVPLNPPSFLKFYNIYGPTETTVFATTFKLINDSKLLPIGVPNQNTKLYVIDKNMRQVPVGAMGELCIAGEQVGRGYLNRPEKTAEVFVENPFTDNPDYKRMYKTGDIVRWLPDGNIEFIGRRDGQVKIRGFRIELTEVEQIIRQYEGIKDATVTAIDAPGGGKMLVAYIVSDNKVDTKLLGDFIKSSKPPYMVPSVIMQLEKIPLNVNGKVDKRKLPKPDTSSISVKGKEPADELEKKICTIFEKTLGITKVFADDDFFDIGGSSISAAKVAMKCMNEGLKVVYSNIFDYSSPEKLAAFINKESGNVISEHKESIPADKIEKDTLYEALKYNTTEYVDEISHSDIGNVLVTGAVGFLGIHVVKELIDSGCQKIYCLLRGKDNKSVEGRLKMMMMYYFDDTFDELFGKRIIPINGDITDNHLIEIVKNVDFDTMINCAASVKHFAKDDLLDRVNFHGVENLVKICLRLGKKLIQVSTRSVAGQNVDNALPENTLIFENMHYFGQNLENKYCHTKWQAEKAILEAIINDGLKAKIVRVGNLMSRAKDGEFQANYSSNSFMNTLRAYKVIEYFPVAQMDAPIEFSPIDFTAKAIVTLAGTPDKFTVFHAWNNHIVDFANVIKVMNDCGLNIKTVTTNEFQQEFDRVLKDENKNQAVMPLIAYLGNNANRVDIEGNNNFTIKALYRLGFAWPLISEDYIHNAVHSLETLGFFE